MPSPPTDQPATICDECGIREGRRRLDPYAQEIEGVDRERTLCDECYADIARDI